MRYKIDRSLPGLSSKNYSDVYDSKAGSLTNKLTDTDYSKASDDELMSCLLYTSLR